MIKPGLLFITLISFSFVDAQVIDRFKANITDNSSVLLGWTVVSGKTCSDMGLEFADETLNFQTLHFIAGVCGSDIEDLNYSFEHADELSGKIHYRIRFNFDEFSDTISIVAPVNQSQALWIYPQPAKRQLNIQLNRESIEATQLFIFEPGGRLLFQSDLSRQNPIPVDVSSLLPGYYLIKLVSGNKQFNSRFIICD
jgi:hypothetical protein